MKNIILVKNMKDAEAIEKLKLSLNETRVDYQIDTYKQCVIIEGNSDMVAIARKVVNDHGFIIV